MLLAAVLAACSPSGETAAPRGNLDGASVGGPFSLVDETGRAVTNDSYAGRWRLMYFGFTFCPDVCPTDAAKLAGGLRAFEKLDAARAARVQPLFVTVDPERDTPAALREFTDAFHPRLVGLTGTPEQVKAALSTFRVYANKAPGASPDSYLVDHFAAIYLFDPAGKPVAFIPGPEASADKVRDMLATYVA